ncbi:GAF domain-containing protein [Celerinatantimonas yamalensis]|uniref:GAF domain-containing protein n=1 Tax=Celerinatantimonas yamalensis TaxID=559956 RepID=A0ABW9G204_9GAMM
MDWQNWLNDGCEALGMENGAITVCCGRHLTVIHHAEGGKLITSGDSFDRRGTFCEQVMNQRDLVTYNAPIDELSTIQFGNVVIATSIQAYIGYPLIVRDIVFGTLNFSSAKRRADGFSTHDLFITEMMANDYVQYNLAPNRARM